MNCGTKPWMHSTFPEKRKTARCKRTAIRLAVSCFCVYEHVRKGALAAGKQQRILRTSWKGQMPMPLFKIRLFGNGLKSLFKRFKVFFRKQDKYRFAKGPLF